MPRLLIVIVACFFASSSGGDVTQQTSVDTQHKQGSLEPAMTTTQELAPGSPEEVGMSAERLNKIDDVVQEYIDAGRIQGVVIGVTRRNKVVYMEAHGVIDKPTQRPMRKDSLFHMVSSTKPVLGVAAGRFWTWIRLYSWYYHES